MSNNDPLFFGDIFKCNGMLDHDLYGNCELLKDFGPLKAGTKFDCIQFVDEGEGKLTLDFFAQGDESGEPIASVEVLIVAKTTT